MKFIYVNCISVLLCIFTISGRGGAQEAVTLDNENFKLTVATKSGLHILVKL